MFGGKIGLPELVIILMIGIVPVVLFGEILHKAGYSRWLGLLVIIPLANFVTVIWFASSKWPLLVEVEALRNELRSRPGGAKP